MITYEQELAKWKVERGRDLTNNSWAIFFGILITCPPAALIALPFSIVNGRKGKKLREEGEAEGGLEHEQPRVRRGGKFIPAVKEELYKPNGRYQDASLTPPTQLV